MLDCEKSMFVPERLLIFSIKTRILFTINEGLAAVNFVINFLMKQ